MNSLKSVDDFTIMGNMLGFPDPSLSADALRFSNYAVIMEGFSMRTNDLSYYSGLFGYVEAGPKPVTFVNLVINTLIYAVGGAFLHSFTTMTTSYLCAKYKYKYSEFIYAMLLVIMTIPIVGASVSNMKVMRDLGLYNSILGMFIANMHFTGIYFFVFYAFMEGISNTYIEAAEIDGASQLRIYLHIIVPLSSKLLFTVFLLQFIGLWNDYSTPLLYYPGYPTLAYGVYYMSQNTSGENNGLVGTSLPSRVAGCMILVLPLLVLFIACKNVILGNLSMGGLKE
jgi:ABC-type glycerol-3-phosphate transport system permease component